MWVANSLDVLVERPAERSISACASRVRASCADTEPSLIEVRAAPAAARATATSSAAKTAPLPPPAPDLPTRLRNKATAPPP